MSLQGDDFLCDSIPVGKGLQIVGLLAFQFFADGCLLGQVFLFGLLDGFEVCLMALVDHGGSVLESCPEFFAYFLGHGTCLLPFLMQFLQLVECLYHI